MMTILSEVEDLPGEAGSNAEASDTGTVASDAEDDDDVVGSLPRFQVMADGIPTAPTDNAEYDLMLPTSVSSMSFSVSPTEIDLPVLPPSRLAAFDRYLADDASEIDTDADEFSAYLSQYSTFTEFTANTNATEFSTNSNTSMLSTQLVPSATCGPLRFDAEEQEDIETPTKGSMLACFADMPWLQFPSLAQSAEEKEEVNATEEVIVKRSQSNLILSSVLPSQRMGYEDLLRMAIATTLNLVAEQIGAATATTRSSTQNGPGGLSTSLVRKACSGITVYQPPPRSPPTTPAQSAALNMESSIVVVGAGGRDERPLLPGTTGLRGLPSNTEAAPDQGCGCSAEAQDMPGCTSFIMDMLFGSMDLTTEVLLELETNGVFLKASEKFDSLDEDAQIRFINRHNLLLLGPPSPPSPSSPSSPSSSRNKAPSEVEIHNFPTSNQLILGVSSSREKEEAFFNAFLHLVSSSTISAVEEISTYFASACSATKESTEKVVAFTAPKAVAKIIETDIIEQLESSSVIEEIPPVQNITDDNDHEQSIEISYEQYQALQRSKSLFNSGLSFDFSRYLQAAKKAKAHLSTMGATATTKEDNVSSPVCERSSTEEETAPPTKDEIAPPTEEEMASEEQNTEKQTSPTENDHKKSKSFISTLRAAVATKKGNERESVPVCEGSSSEEETAPTENVHKTAFKCEVVIPEEETEKNEAEDICQRILQEHVKRKKKVELAKKKALQDHLDKSRSRSAKAPNDSSSDENILARNGIKANKKVKQAQKVVRSSAEKPPFSKERRDQDGAVRNFTSGERSPPGPVGPVISRTKAGVQRSYKVTTGLKKTRRPLKSR